MDIVHAKMENVNGVSPTKRQILANLENSFRKFNKEVNQYSQQFREHIEKENNFALLSQQTETDMFAYVNSLNIANMMNAQYVTNLRYSRCINNMLNGTDVMQGSSPTFVGVIETDLPRSISASVIDRSKYKLQDGHIILYENMSEFEVGQQFVAQITYVTDIDNNIFYVSKMNNKALLKLSGMKNLPLLKNLPTDKDVIFAVNIWQKIYRARQYVPEYGMTNRTHVILIDCGSVVLLDDCNGQYQLPMEFLNIPAQAILCQLLGVLDINCPGEKFNLQQVLRSLQNKEAIFWIKSTENSKLVVDILKNLPNHPSKMQQPEPLDDQITSTNKKSIPVTQIDMNNNFNINDNNHIADNYKLADSKEIDNKNQIEDTCKIADNSEIEENSKISYNSQNDENNQKDDNSQNNEYWQDENVDEKSQIGDKSVICDNSSNDDNNDKIGNNKSVEDTASSNTIETIADAISARRTMKIFITHIVGVVEFYAQMPYKDAGHVNLSWTDDEVDCERLLTAMPKVDELVLARYKADGLWYRAKILTTNEKNLQMTVFFIDYGNEETVRLHAVASLTKEMQSKPPRVMLFKLIDVEDGTCGDSEQRERAMQTISFVLINEIINVEIVQVDSHNTVYINFVDEDVIRIKNNLIKMNFATTTSKI